MTFCIARREFITLLGGAAVARPLAARAQRPAMPVIGVLHSASPETSADRLPIFRQGLKEVGYIEGENVVIEYRWAENQFDRLPALANDLVRRRVTVLAALGSNLSAIAAKEAAMTIPVVFIVSEDPVRLGLVSSLARPGGNLTGINILNAELAAKRLEVLHEIVPNAVRVAALVNPTSITTTETTLRDLEAAAQRRSLQIQVVRARTSQEINEAFAAFEHERPHALFVAQDGLFSSRRIHLVHLATRYAIPAAYGSRDFAEAGGLMSYGANIVEAYRQVGTYTGRILKGSKAADLPVVQSSKLELLINAETARTLRLSVPPTLLARADEVIE